MKPILFNTEMVKAIQEGRKTQTRRPCKGLGEYNNSSGIKADGKTLVLYRKNYNTDEVTAKPQYSVGDILYVRETWKQYEKSAGQGNTYRICKRIGYKANEEKENNSCEYAFAKWRPSIHMPKDAARLFLKVTGVRCERVRDISADDSVKEGIYVSGGLYRGEIQKNKCKSGYVCPRNAFSGIWNACYGKKYPWENNPFVFVYEFELTEKPE